MLTGTHGLSSWLHNTTACSNITLCPEKTLHIYLDSWGWQGVWRWLFLHRIRAVGFSWCCQNKLCSLFSSLGTGPSSVLFNYPTLLSLTCKISGSAVSNCCQRRGLTSHDYRLRQNAQSYTPEALTELSLILNHRLKTVLSIVSLTLLQNRGELPL